MTLIERIQAYVYAVKNDFEASLDMLADDVTWVNLLPENVPFGGTYSGKQEVLRYFGEMAATFELGEYLWDQFEYIESGGTLVMIGFEKDGVALPTGKIFDLHFVWVIKFDADDKIVYVREHNDTAAIGDAFKA